MEFLHCNGCGHIPGHLDARRYYLTSCGHVFCEVCSRRIKDVCAVCQANCRLVEISSDSKNEIKAYFMDPIDIIKDSMRRLTQVMQFQRTQQKSYNVQFVKLIEAQKSWNSEREAMKAEISMLKSKLDATQQCEQNWIGSGVLRSPQEGGNGFFVQTSDKTLNSLFTSNPTPIKRQSTSGHIPSQPIFQGHSPTPLGQRCAPGHSPTSLGQRCTPGHSPSPLGQRCAPGRLTIPHTPQRRDHQRLYSSPGFASTNATPASSTGTGRFSTPGNSDTPDIVSRLKQLRWANTPGSAPKTFSMYNR